MQFKKKLFDEDKAQTNIWLLQVDFEQENSLKE